MCRTCRPTRLAHIRKVLRELRQDLRTIHRAATQRPNLKPAVQRQDWCTEYAPKGMWAECKHCGHPRRSHITEMNGA